MLVFNAGLFAPEIIRVDRAQVQEQIVSAYREWHAIYLDRHAFEPENIRFVHNPDWRNKFFSIQSAHDGNHFIWRATSIIVAFAQGMFSPFGVQVSANVISQAERDLAKIVFTVRQLCEGRSNAVGSFTLGSNVASTHITAVTCGAGSSVLVTPVTSTAATEYGAGTMYVSSTVNGSFYATHASNSIAARTFVFAVLG